MLFAEATRDPMSWQETITILGIFAMCAFVLWAILRRL